ncbi:MAG: small integral membrane protein [Peptococcaceae bacterium BRH_c8a]|nr:MAG: small integral membrane protein [Peptococcaceae bacterium BRH_c8a]
MDKHLVIEWITLHRGKILGAVAGLAVGISIILFGVLKTFFVAICVVLGYLAGKQLDDRVDIRDKILRLLGER